jgi:hypothetical protein
MMSLRSALFAVAVLVGGAVLILVGGVGAILFLTNRQCGASGYLCEAPTGNIRDGKDHADPTPPDHRFGGATLRELLRSEHVDSIMDRAIDISPHAGTGARV